MTPRAAPSSTIGKLAEQLLAYESARSADQHAAVFLVNEKLRRRLTTLIGVAAFHAVLVRALALASTIHPGTGFFEVSSDGSLRFSEAVKGGVSRQMTQDLSAEADVALIAHFLGLLVTFIGEGMTFHLVIDTWPDLPVSDSETWRERS